MTSTRLKGLNIKAGGKKILPEVKRNKLVESNDSNSTTQAEIELKNSKTKFNICPITPKRNPINREKFEIDCDSDKVKDLEFLTNISKRESEFYQIKIGDVYQFLNELNLVRFIESFIMDGFENMKDILEIQEDYFEENKNFTKEQQKKILDKIGEIKKKKQKDLFENTSIIQKDKKKTSEMGTICDLSEDKEKDSNQLRCFYCYKTINKKEKFIQKKYKDSIITRMIIFCSLRCMEQFEDKFIMEICESCKVKYDKSKGDYIFEDFHFHSQKCKNDFISKYNKRNKQSKIIKESSLEYEDDIDEVNQYDPMEDF